MEASDILKQKGCTAEVIDLKTVTPLDNHTLTTSVSKTGRLLVVDEDYRDFGLSGELAARVLEAGIAARYARICTETTIPYSRDLEDMTLPNVHRIVGASLALLQ